VNNRSQRFLHGKRIGSINLERLKYLVSDLCPERPFNATQVRNMLKNIRLLVVSHDKILADFTSRQAQM